MALSSSGANPILACSGALTSTEIEYSPGGKDVANFPLSVTLSIISSSLNIGKNVGI